MSSFGNDLATLAALQIRLAACDLRDSTRTAAPIAAGLTASWLVASASVVVGLAGLALWIASRYNLEPGLVLMLVALAGLVLSTVGAAVLARSLSRSFTSFRRSQEELQRNLAWIRTTLVHSGR